MILEVGIYWSKSYNDKHICYNCAWALVAGRPCYQFFNFKENVWKTECLKCVVVVTGCIIRRKKCIQTRICWFEIINKNGSKESRYLNIEKFKNPLAFFFILFILLWWVLSYIEMKQPWVCMCSHPDPPSHLPLHPIPLGLPSAPGPSACLMHPIWAGDLFHPR